MKLRVFLSPHELSPGAVLGQVFAVIDVLRASTSMATALANGARSVVPWKAQISRSFIRGSSSEVK